MTTIIEFLLRAGNLRFEIESTDKEWIDSKEKEYLSKLGTQQSQTSSESSAKPEVVTTASLESLSVNEFYQKFAKSKITSRPDLATFFVYYLSKVQKQDTIKNGDVTNCFAAIGYPSYNTLNMADILSKAKHKAFLNYVNNSWSMTLTGEDFVVNKLSDKGE